MYSYPVHPYGIRVWIGYRHPDFLPIRQKFVRDLGNIFIPQTVQQMGDLGLCAYFPMVLPDTDNLFPDEVALVVYPSPAVYRSAKSDSVAGRAYAALHGPYFNFKSLDGIPRSKSAFPESWQGNLDIGTPYALFGNSVDWHTGSTHVGVIKKPVMQATPIFIEDIKRSMADVWDGKSSSNECIVQVEESYALIWEHVGEGDFSSYILDAVCDGVPTEDVIRSEATVTTVPSVFKAPDPGIDPVEGSLMDVRVF